MEAKFATVRQQRIAQGDSQAEERLLHLSASPQVQGHCLQVQVPNPSGPVGFQLFLSPHFPLEAPRLTCTSHFPQLSLADGRDLLSTVLGKPWSPEMSLAEVATALPEFVVRVT